MATIAARRRTALFGPVPRAAIFARVVVYWPLERFGTVGYDKILYRWRRGLLIDSLAAFLTATVPAGDSFARRG